MRAAFILLGGALVLAACGETRGERALTGAGIGAASGAVGAEIIGGSVRGGALLGGLAGAAVGAATAEGRGRRIFRDDYDYDD
ncbi:MAG: hypothetical protein AAGE80_09755 [Pseudomonadota bacterium]